ncbi:MAG: hypothetical protein NDJ24_08285 [Alphaproteobacteria bacterium]|nr:hypothetical protein [Alphaproteobacteria bacterium]
MESRLDGIFRTGLRLTENADTRLGIRRDESEDGQHPKKQHEREPDAASGWEDQTTLSVIALQQFLRALIATDSIYQPAPEQHTAPVTLSPQQKTAHQAAHAYQSTARHTPPVPPATPPVPIAPPPDNPTLSAAENRAIHLLLQDLDILLQQGKTTLSIRKDGNFLESLQKAVAAALV